MEFAIVITNSKTLLKNQFVKSAKFFYKNILQKIVESTYQICHETSYF